MHCMEIFGGSSAREEKVSTPGLDAWIFSAPFEGAADGGDVHYVSLCGGGVITRLILADVSGHGRDVAEVASSLRSLMRKNINSKSQTRLVRALNRQFGAMAQLQRFATAIVATYLATRKTLSVCNGRAPSALALPRPGRRRGASWPPSPRRARGISRWGSTTRPPTSSSPSPWPPAIWSSSTPMR